MHQRALSPILVGRQEELSDLEDALLAANRGEGRFVLLAGEAGIGKTRLATELARRARKLGFDVLWGSCSEAELPLPYLPFVEAIGNHLDDQDLGLLRDRLGPAAAELAQLLPQLSEGSTPSAGDPAQAKLRLFESVVALLELWAADRSIVVVLDDVHWADSSTRELLDYAGRRLARSRAVLLATYRSDELDRHHPLTTQLQVWRRAGLAETVVLPAMPATQVAAMIAAILDVDDVRPDLVDLVMARSEGNPFVLEEMLREAIDRGEALDADGGRQRPDALPMPETVREALLLRVDRLEPMHVEVLRAAAVLGRSFDYDLLAEVAEASDDVVLAAVESAVAQQLVEEDAEAGQRYRWRHAITQEAVAGDIVLPKRHRIHSRAADALITRGASATAVASHLLGAARTEEAVEACLRAAEEAERAIAFAEAAVLLEHVLPHVSSPRERALLTCRMGVLRWRNGESAAAEQLLEDGVRQLDDLGLELEAARARVHLGRCRWELDQPDAAMRDLERARDILEAEAPSPELALAHLRIAGMHAFDLDYEGSRVSAERAAEIAEQASADFERLWALSFVALGYLGSAKEFDLLERCYREALAKDYAIIAANAVHNEIWDRVHTLAGGLPAALAKADAIPPHPWAAAGTTVARGWALLGMGDPRKALEQAREAIGLYESSGGSKFAWRARLTAAESLFELGRTSEAANELPPPSPGSELQDVVYDTPARVRIALALGRVDEAVELARRASERDAFLVFADLVALAVEAFLAGGRVDEAKALLSRARQTDAETGRAGIDLAEGQILLAAGKAVEARSLLESAQRTFEQAELWLWAWRARTLAAEAAAETGAADDARALLASAARDAHEIGATRVRDEALEIAGRLGLEVPSFPADDVEPEQLRTEERLVTSLFADVRGYTSRASTDAPEELADRLATLHRWAAAEVGRRHGIVDKFAGDAVMATFNATGTRLDHAALALEAALALRDKAALMELPVGIGIAVGPAVVTRTVERANMSVLGSATNLAARLQAAAEGGEILLSEEAFRRVNSWLDERSMKAEPRDLELKGFDTPQPAYRLSATTR